MKKLPGKTGRPPYLTIDTKLKCIVWLLTVYLFFRDKDVYALWKIATQFMKWPKKNILCSKPSGNAVCDISLYQILVKNYGNV